MSISAQTLSKNNETPIVQQTVYSILFSIAFAHLLNDLMQIVIPSTYPLLKEKFNLSFTQIGLITFVFQLTASILQPFIGFYTDKKPKPYSLVIGMIFTVTGLVFLSLSSDFWMLLVSVSFVGIGSSIFHPEASRVAFLGSGGKRGLAQSIFQLGGKCRKCDRAIIGGFDCSTSRTILYHLVCNYRCFGDANFVKNRQLVSKPFGIACFQ